MTEDKINELEKNFQSGMEQIMPHIVGHKTAQNLIIDSFKEAIQALQEEWIGVEDRLPTHNDLLPSNGDPRYKEPLILVWDFEANLPSIIHYVTFEKEYYSHWKIINLAPPNK